VPQDDPVALARGDSGAILLIVLFVTTVLAVVIGVVLTSVEVNLRNSTVAQNVENKTYAADGGVEYVIQRLRQDPAACSDPALGPWQQNNVTVTLTCASLSGSTTFGSGWAAVTTSTGTSSLLTTPGNGIGINGPTFVAGGLDLRSDLTVRKGPLVQASTPCPKKTGAGQLFASSECATAAVPAGVAALPCIDNGTCSAGTLYNLAPRGPDPSYTIGSGPAECRIFLPGNYAAAPVLGPHNYFASGIYYFDNVGVINVDGVELSGGNPGTGMSLVDASPCANDADAGVNDGSGVEWILGGTSAISVGTTPGTTFELFARQPATSAREGAAGISIRSVPSPAPAGYAPTTSSVFTMGGGQPIQVAVHGLVYAPNSDVTVSATSAHGSELTGGVVASTLHLIPQLAVLPGPDGMVSIRPSAVTDQFFTISATAQGGATKNVTTTAVIELRNDDATRPVVIDSWVTNAA
jgi:hypothetical protein